MAKKVSKKKAPDKKVSYTQLTQLAKLLYKRIRADELYFNRISASLKVLADDIERKKARIKDLEDNADSIINIYQDRIEAFYKANVDLKSANTELIKKNYEITRAYNGLAEMGKFAEENGIDIKKYTKELPENNKYDFSQKHEVLESGKVKSTWKLTPKKKPKGKSK